MMLLYPDVHGTARLPNVDPAALTGDPVNTWCPSPRWSLTGRRRRDNFMCGKRTDFMLCRASTLLNQLDIVPTKGRKVTELGFVVRLI
jgi:hypothetical protein